MGFALFSLGSFLGRWKGITPFVFLGSDAGIVSSFVAGYEHPELFRGDVLLGNFGNFRYYLAAHPLLIYTISKVTGDYGSAYISLLLVTPLLQASGFYLLGRVLFNSRYWALLLSIITLCPIALPIREFWGIYDDPLPRSLFHACIPYVLAGAFYFRDDYTKWPWLMAATGLLFYAHPVSSPHWGFGIWIGMCAFLPHNWSLQKKLLYMFALGLVYVAVALPWAANFLQVHDQAGVTGIQYSQVINIIADRVGIELLSVGLALQMWGRELLSWPLWFYCSWALCAVAVVSFLHPETRKGFLLVAFWGLGILAVAVGITFAEEVTCHIWNLPRFQMDSIRGIKYLVPIFLLFSLWPLAEISNRLPTRSLKKCGARVGWNIAGGHMGLSESTHLLPGRGTVLGPIPADAPCIGYGNRDYSSGGCCSRENPSGGPDSTNCSALGNKVCRPSIGGLRLQGRWNICRYQLPRLVGMEQNQTGTRANSRTRSRSFHKAEETIGSFGQTFRSIPSYRFQN